MTDEDRLADLLLTWEERFQEGKELSAEELCRDCPELTQAAASRIKALKRTAWVNSPAIAGPTSGSVERESPLSVPVTLVQRYRLEKLIGEGGYGQVWRGFDQELQRQVAVKMPRNRHGTENEAAFLAEARRVAQLQHPGIVPVHDVGRHNGAYFIVSELIDGQDLGAVLQRKSLAVREAVRIVAAVASHLHHAHQQGFVHRDIKPPNILLGRHDQVYLTDFGIALTQEEMQLSGDDGCGTLAYMSPEQLHGETARIDHRTDIYSLGVVLYQVLSSSLPFDADTAEGLRDKVLRQEPKALRSLQKRVPKEVERICLKCLAKSPANRYANADALAEELRTWAERRRRHPFLVGAMAIALLGVIGLIAYQQRLHPNGNIPLEDFPLALKGEWTGEWEESDGETGNGCLHIEEQPDRRIVGEWNTKYKIEDGRRMGHDILFWESTVRNRDCQVLGKIQDKGRQLLLVYAMNFMKDGKAQALLGMQRLTRNAKEPLSEAEPVDLSGDWSGKYANSLGEVGDLRFVLKDAGDGTITVRGNNTAVFHGVKSNNGVLRWEEQEKTRLVKVEGEWVRSSLRLRYTVIYPPQSPTEGFTGISWFIRD